MTALDPSRFAIFTQADAEMLEVVMRADVDYLDYSPLYDEECDS